MIKYYYSSAKIRQENSKNVINREVTSAKDDIQVRNPRTTTRTSTNQFFADQKYQDEKVSGSLLKAIKTACTAIRSKMTNPVKSGSSYIETMNTPTYGMHPNSTIFKVIFKFQKSEKLQKINGVIQSGEFSNLAPFSYWPRA